MISYDSPRRAVTSFDYYQMGDFGDSYEREVTSRQSMHRDMGIGRDSPGFQANPNLRENVTNIGEQFKNPTVTFERPPSQAVYRPPSQLHRSRPPLVSAYRPRNQLSFGLSRSMNSPVNQSLHKEYRAPSQLGNTSHSQMIQRPMSQAERRSASRMGHMGTRDNLEVAITEPIRNDDDQQIFVRKPTETRVNPPLYRLGSHGAPWKHVKSVINSSGSHLCWIDGCIKQDENTVFPMYWYRSQPARRLVRAQVNPSSFNSSNQGRGKNGYQQWCHNKTPMKYTDYSKPLNFGSQLQA